MSARGLLFLFCAAAAGFAAEFKPGTAYFGTERWIEYDAGDSPIVLTSPHGGRLRPDALPDRDLGLGEGAKDVAMKAFTMSYDRDSQELARAISDAILALTGQRPHLIASQLHRRKLDPNRDVKEAAAGNPGAERAWREFHGFIETALAAAVARHGFAFLVDVHGHSHPIKRVELGYALSTVQLNQPDAAIDASDFAAISTLRDLHARLGGSGAALLRGPRSLGDLFVQHGYPAVPSPQDPQPGKNPYFSGAYIVHHHAAAPATTKVDGLQIETYYDGIRNTPANRERFAKAAAEVLATFLRERYHYEPIAKK